MSTGIWRTNSSDQYAYTQPVTRILLSYKDKAKRLVKESGVPDRVYDYIAKRIDAAVQILRERVIRDIKVWGLNYVSIRLRAAQAKGPRTDYWQARLDGEVDLRTVNPSDYYSVVAGPYAAKCTCPDAIYATATAQRKLEALAKRMRDRQVAERIALFAQNTSRYSPCKHAILGLAICEQRGICSPSDVERMLRRMLAVAYARVEERLSPRTVLKLIQD